MTTVTMTVNGKSVSETVEGRTLLSTLLRDDLRLTGTHIGCDTSQCGACVVHVNGKAVKSCTMFAIEAQGAEVSTIEGQANADGSLNVIQQAFQDHHGLQCGFCTSRYGDDDSKPVERKPQANRGRGTHLPGRQHLPLHRLPQHRESDHGCVRSRCVFDCC